MDGGLWLAVVFVVRPSTHHRNPRRPHGCRSIVFPSISTGIYGFPIREAAPLAIRASYRKILIRPDWSVFACSPPPIGLHKSGVSMNFRWSKRRESTR